MRIFFCIKEFKTFGFTSIIKGQLYLVDHESHLPKSVDKEDWQELFQEADFRLL